jgi:hypothetical protein
LKNANKLAEPSSNALTRFEECVWPSRNVCPECEDCLLLEPIMPEWRGEEPDQDRLTFLFLFVPNLGAQKCASLS